MYYHGESINVNVVVTNNSNKTSTKNSHFPVSKWKLRKTRVSLKRIIPHDVRSTKISIDP